MPANSVHQQRLEHYRKVRSYLTQTARLEQPEVVAEYERKAASERVRS